MFMDRPFSRADAAKSTSYVSDMRSINTALLSYYATNNAQYPDKLNDLVEQGYIILDELRINELTIHYIKPSTPLVGDHIIAYTSKFEPDYGTDKYKVIIALVDGSAEHISAYKLQALLDKQASTTK